MPILRTLFVLLTALFTVPVLLLFRLIEAALTGQIDNPAKPEDLLSIYTTDPQDIINYIKRGDV